MKKEFIITDEVGLHARPATLLVTEAGKYASDIKIITNGKEANLKSIMGVMSLGIAKDQLFDIEAEGGDQEDAVNGIGKVLVDNNIAREQ